MRNRVLEATEEALDDGVDEPEKLKLLREVLVKKMYMSGTKVQIKPTFKDGTLEKLQLILKWGGEFTHSALYQSKDLGENMRKDIILINKECLDDVKVFTSSERRVSASGNLVNTSHANWQLRSLPVLSLTKKDYQGAFCKSVNIFLMTRMQPKI
jgi:hypothetical protein